MKLRMEVKKMLKSIKEMLWEEEAVGGICFETGYGIVPLLEACFGGGKL